MGWRHRLIIENAKLNRAYSRQTKDSLNLHGALQRFSVKPSLIDCNMGNRKYCPGYTEIR